MFAYLLVRSDPVNASLYCLTMFIFLLIVWLLSEIKGFLKLRSQTKHIMQFHKLPKDLYSHIEVAILKSDAKAVETIIDFAKERQMSIKIALLFQNLLSDSLKVTEALILYYSWRIAEVEDIAEAILKFHLLDIPGHEMWKYIEFKIWFKEQQAKHTLRNVNR